MPAIQSFLCEYDFGIERKEKWRHVGNRRCGDDVAGNCRPVADLPGSEGPQHLVEHRVFAGERFFERRKRDTATDAPHRIVLFNRREFLHGFRRYEQRIAAVVLVDVDTDLGRAGYEFRFRTMLGLDRQELLQRLRADKGRSV